METNGQKFKSSVSKHYHQERYLIAMYTTSQLKFNGPVQTLSALKIEYLKFIYLNCGIDILLQERSSQFICTT